MYHDPTIRESISRMVGQEVFSCQNEDEWMVANYLTSVGDTHGWHLDDPPIAFVLVLLAPPKGEGGQLEYFPLSTKLAGVDVRHEHAMIADHRAGDAYLLRADQCLHRVAPLIGSGRRLAINMAFEFDEEVTYGTTASMLYQ